MSRVNWTGSPRHGYRAVMNGQTFMVREEGPYWYAYTWDRARKDWAQHGPGHPYALWAMRECAREAGMKVGARHMHFHEGTEVTG